MTSADVLDSSSLVFPAGAALPSQETNAALRPSASLSASLPSPPESSTKTVKQPKKAHGQLALHTLPAGTPAPSPASCTASIETSSGKPSKKVDFSTWTASANFPDSEVSIRSLPPSRECRSSKSILKPGQVSLPDKEGPSGRTEDLITMLDTILLQLASADGQIMLDAYATLVSALKTYAELPDGRITKEKVQSLLSFTRRDLTRQNSEPMEPPEINLTLQALKLVVTIVWSKTLSVHLSDSYRCFLIDHSTRILEEHKMPKAITLHYLHLLSTQDFSSRIMTTARATRLLEVLKDISSHVRGNGVVSERLMVYHRILEQAKGVLKSRPSCWVAQLLSAMTSSVADTRKRACNLGDRVAVVLGSSSMVATYLHNLMESPGEQEDVLSSTICKKLVKMTKSVDEAWQVPQVWAVVMLLMGGLGQKFGEWQRLRDWLQVIQICFNSSDAAVRTEANKAWNKLVYVAGHFGGTKSFLTKMLIKPILVQLDRSSKEKQSKSTKNSAFAAYCNLLYYALKPSASFSHYDTVWNEYIVSAYRAPFLSNERNSDRACRILIGLFWREKISPWRENRALDAAVIEPEELPLLDCKWIRSRSRSILGVFQLLFRTSCWGLAAYPDSAYIAVAWRNFAKALGDACRKEVRLSAETVEAMTHILRFLIEICENGPPSMNSANGSYVSRFHFICKTIMLELGPMSFTEGTLMNAIDNSSIACRPESGATRRPPVLDLLKAMQSLPISAQDGPYFDMIIDLLLLSSKARSSVKGRIRFYSQCAQVIFLDECRSSQRCLTWSAISKLTCTEIANSAVSSLSDWADAEDILASTVIILECGVPYSRVQSKAWTALLKQSLSVTNGCDRLPMVVPERLSSCLSNHNSDDSSLCTAILVREILGVLHSSAFFGNRKATPKATKRQHGEMMSVYRRVVGLLDLHLSRAYSLADCCDDAALQSVIDAAISLLQTCSVEHTLACLTGMQKSLALWLEDAQRLMTTTSRVGSLKLLQARKLCPVIIEVLGKFQEEVDLRSLDILFGAAFRTSHKITINQVVEMWNSNYGTRKSSEYGNMLKEALARLRPFVDLELPDPHQLEPLEVSPPALYYLEDSESDENGQGSGDRLSTHGFNPKRPLPAFDHVMQLGCSAATDVPRVTTPIKASAKGRPRHDDSQVYFVSIESSPLPGRNAESVHLTERQKDVRERQNREASLLFPDLRSSPLVMGEVLKAGVETSSLSVAGDRQDRFKDAHPATPILPSRQRVDYEEAAQLSPTPKSKQQALGLDDIEVPSSPASTGGLVDGVYKKDGFARGSRQEDARASPLPQNTLEVDLVEDVPAKCHDVDGAADDTYTRVTDDSDTALPKVARRDQTVGEQTFAKNSEDEVPSDEVPADEVPADEVPADEVPADEVPADVGKVPVRRAKEKLEDVLLGKASMHDRSADIIATKEQTLPKHLRRTSWEKGEVAASLRKVADSISEVVMTGTTTTPQTNGSIHRHRDPPFETPTKVRTTSEEHIKIYSDDNDFWSASQLSQELERAASSAPSPSLGSQLVSSPLASAKRKQLPASGQTSKRRKITGDLVRPEERPSSSSNAPEQHPSQAIYDCIEVDSTCASQQSSRAASAAPQASTVLQPLKRGRGRPRKMQPPRSRLSSPADMRKSSGDCEKDARHKPTARIEVCVPTEAGHQADLSKTSVGADKPLSNSKNNPDKVFNSSGTSSWDSGPRDSSGEIKEADKENQVTSEEAMRLLQKALSSLKNTSMGRSELRAIDDLVFEIRTEAQNAAQRSGKGGQ